MNQPYDAARYSMVTHSFDWLGYDLVLTAWGGLPSFVATDKKVSDIVARGGAPLIGVSLPVTAKSVLSDGTCQTNQVVIPAVPVGPAVTYFTLCKRATPVDQSDLLLFIDDAENLPYSPNGLDLVVQPDWALQRGWFRA